MTAACEKCGTAWDEPSGAWWRVSLSRFTPKAEWDQFAELLICPRCAPTPVRLAFQMVLAIKALADRTRNRV